MTVVEVWPGTGWYTEILAPLLRERGTLYAAHLDPAASEYARSTVETFKIKLADRPDLYDKVILTTLAAPPAKNELAPPGSADLVLTFRNLHNWMMFGWQREALQAMHAALKPGGVLGIVEHRGVPGVPQDAKAASGYVEREVRDRVDRERWLQTRRPFRGQRESHATPRTTRKACGRCRRTTQPAMRTRARYAAIGESDRFTLKFVKVAQ